MSDAAPPRRDPRALLALAFVQVCFGIFPVFGKIAMREVPPLVLASFRAVLGAAVLTLAARLSTEEEPRLTAADRRKLIVLSLLGVAANQTLFISGLSITTATNATLLVATIPVFTLLFGTLSRKEPASPARLLGVPVALSGVVLLLDLGRLDFRGATFAGDLMIAANSASYALYLLAAREILARRSALSVIASVFRWGAIPVLLLALPDLLRFHPSQVSRDAWLSVAAVVVFSTVLAYTLNAWGLARTDAATAAVFVYLQPLIAGTLAFFLLGETPSSRTFAAAGLIFAGVALAVLPGFRKAYSAAP